MRMKRCMCVIACDIMCDWPVVDRAGQRSSSQDTAFALVEQPLQSDTENRYVCIRTTIILRVYFLYVPHADFICVYGSPALWFPLGLVWLHCRRFSPFHLEHRLSLSQCLSFSDIQSELVVVGLRRTVRWLSVAKPPFIHRCRFATAMPFCVSNWLYICANQASRQLPTSNYAIYR